MSKIQKKWRESLIDLSKLKLKTISDFKVISYPPAGNDVFECVNNENDEHFIIKSERGTFANFKNEINMLDMLDGLLKIPKVIEYGEYDGRTYIVLSKIEGEKLSDIFKSDKNINKSEYLYKYGMELARIHSLNIECDHAKLRSINDIPPKEKYELLCDEWVNKVANYLILNKPNIEYNTFIHGDFHYGNVLFNESGVNGILDWEYSGLGFKEQDIAWALILRPGQRFMITKKDRDSFLEGYKSISTYDEDMLKWCYINGMLHFYLMNLNKGKVGYLKNIKSIIDKSINNK